MWRSEIQYGAEIVLIMRTDRLCLRYLFTVLRLLLDKRPVEQDMRSLYLFDKEAFGSTSCFWFVCSSLTLQPEAPVTIYEPVCRIFQFPVAK